jgi:hypothetical protein
VKTSSAAAGRATHRNGNKTDRDDGRAIETAALGVGDRIVRTGRADFATPATAAKRKQTEKQFMQAVIDFARFRGWMVFHPFDSRRSEPGWPDLVLVRDRCLIFAELKVEPNKPTKAQREWLTALDLAGAETYVWYPRMWDAIETVLR